jgi:hypothetical protein
VRQYLLYAERDVKNGVRICLATEDGWLGLAFRYKLSTSYSRPQLILEEGFLIENVETNDNWF